MTTPSYGVGLAALLATLDGIEVVAQAGTGEEAVREVGLSRPDVVVIDLRMPGVDGVEATRRILKGYPKTAVLVLTMFDEDALVADALRAGAPEYLLKRAEQAEIERAIRAVAVGDAIFSSEVAGRVLGAITADREAPALAPLSPREREVLDIVATGATMGATSPARGRLRRPRTWRCPSRTRTSQSGPWSLVCGGANANCTMQTVALSSSLQPRLPWPSTPRP